MSQIQVPKGWKLVSTLDVVPDPKSSIKIGPFGSSLKKHELTDSGIRVLFIENVVNNKFEYKTGKFITRQKYEDLKGFTVKSSDVLVTMMGTIGRVCVVPDDIDTAIISSHLTKITLDQKKILPRYFSLLLTSPIIFDQMRIEARGIAMPGLNSRIIKNLKFILPPLETQKKIVKKLDYILGQLEEKKKEILKLNENSYLKLITFQKNFVGFSFVQYLKNEETEQFYLSELLDDIKLGSNQKADKYAAGIPVLRMPNIQDGEIDYSDLKYIKFTKKDEEKYLLKKYDVLVNRSNSPELVGKSAVFERDDKFAFASYLIRLRINRKKINPYFLVYYLNSPLGRKYVKSVYVKTAGQANINSEHLKALPISLPKLQRQDLLVTMMSKQKLNTNLKDKIRSILEKNHRYEKMSIDLQSRILNEAFTGKLIN